MNLRLQVYGVVTGCRVDESGLQYPRFVCAVFCLYPVITAVPAAEAPGLLPAQALKGMMGGSPMFGKSVDMVDMGLMLNGAAGAVRSKVLCMPI